MPNCFPPICRLPLLPEEQHDPLCTIMSRTTSLPLATVRCTCTFHAFDAQPPAPSTSALLYSAALGPLLLPRLARSTWRLGWHQPPRQWLPFNQMLHSLAHRDHPIAPFKYPHGIRWRGRLVGWPEPFYLSYSAHSYTHIQAHTLSYPASVPPLPCLCLSRSLHHFFHLSLH